MAPIPRSELKYIRHPVGRASPRRSKAAFCAKEPSAMLKAGPLLECPPQKSVIVGGYFPVPQGRDCAIFGNRPPQTRLSMPASGPSAASARRLFRGRPPFRDASQTSENFRLRCSCGQRSGCQSVWQSCLLLRACAVSLALGKCYYMVAAGEIPVVSAPD